MDFFFDEMNMNVDGMFPMQNFYNSITYLVKLFTVKPSTYLRKHSRRLLLPGRL